MGIPKAHKSTLLPLILLLTFALTVVGCASAATPVPDTAQQLADRLPRHPFEDIGVAGLAESTSMPEDAISQSDAMDIATESTWGSYREELLKNYPATAEPAVYKARESVMGPAAEGLPVWVVTLQGWGPSGRCGAPGPPGPEGPEDQPPIEPEPEAECMPGQSNAYIIVNAVSGQVLGSWHYGQMGSSR